MYCTFQHLIKYQKLTNSSLTYFSNLHTPIEQALGVQAAPVLPDVLQ